MLGLETIFKKKESKFKPEIDALITQLENAMESIHSPLGHFLSLVFIDEKPSFPKVN